VISPPHPRVTLITPIYRSAATAQASFGYGLLATSFLFFFFGYCLLATRFWSFGFLDCVYCNDEFD
jgi:hypothetical protein